ncbi:SMP-30/gluconolactonase/LRE family protein [Streptomyces sp. NBC_00669]|uniref:SMP-30/gluconolactonase/LRE family protein n=1 Tax=Streptomyces sp. NBC_00669 TaxID=2976011 RepID=UPI002E33ACBB|nr:SMP-30/gluconolactonase/LRE family protein [Streptomyces sp. NBC_00669]
MSPATSLPAPEIFVRGHAVVGEGPVIDPRTNELLWVDIPAGVLSRTPLAAGGSASGSADGSADGSAPGSASVVARVGMSLGAVAVRDRGGYVAAVGAGLGVIGAAGGGPALTVVHPLLPEPDRRMNDAKCDPAGRFWAGSTTLGFPAGGGALHCWDPDGGMRTALRGLDLPNGLGWSPDGSRFYLADSVRRVVLTAPYEPAAGRLGPLRELLRHDRRDGMPDGLCVDEDGCLWIAVWGAGEVRRHDPRGRLLAVLRLPVSQPSSCAFGPDGTLYVTSASDGLRHGAEPLAGSVFALPGTAFRGVAVGTFAG